MNDDAQPATPTRRTLLGTAALAALAARESLSAPAEDAVATSLPLSATELDELTRRTPLLTSAEKFGGFVREKPAPYSLPPEKLREIGLDRQTWRLEVTGEGDAKVLNPLSREKGTALDFAGLMKLAEKHAVRFIKTLTCTNGKSRFGTGIWEGVPLRNVVWLAQPSQRVRRVYYDGFHNDEAKQQFTSSLTLARVLEDPPGEIPVILCYKYNGDWIPAKMGGPVRMIVPGAYGNKSVKWLQRIFLTSGYQANDTYALWNNDTESPMKTCALFAARPARGTARQPILLTGIAQVGMSGLAKVQWSCCRQDAPLPAEDPLFEKLEWHDASVLGPPPTLQAWGGDLKFDAFPAIPLQFDPATGQPRSWPIRYASAHWVARLAIQKPGLYHLRCRTIDGNGVAQPMPRPMAKSGVNTIDKLDIEIVA